MKIKNEPISIYLIDDEELICQSMAYLLNSQENLHVTGYSTTGDEALKIITTTDIQVFLVDIKLKNENGIVLSGKIKKIKPETKIIIVSSYFNESLLLMAASAGASGYITKNMKVDDLTRAIREVMTSPRFFLHEEYRERTDPMNIELAIKNPSWELTQREIQILTLIAREYTTKEIAKDLNISEKTVRNHKSHIMHKLNIRSDAGLIKHAYTMALI